MLGWRSDNAPRFGGRLEDSLINFLHEFETLATGHGLDDAQKVQAVARYVPPTVRDLWKTLDGYTTRDWAVFRDALEKVYLDVGAASRLLKRTLQDFVNTSAQTRMRNKEDVISYFQQFLQHSNPLRTTNRITDDECNSEFFQGFHTEDHNILASRLFSLKPNHPPERPYNLEDVYKAARGYFSNTQFYQPLQRRLCDDEYAYDGRDHDR
ncbi:hypothetical protein F5148DRAFT_986626 [Russula earlei]|uniref:Uncharacterized protein n=1 Tax=Russula earlei TaxID=71964 RepID=A0ACC0TXU3_9AGAM|nr:hypothetical protein F5148DRAFT_986626 [Russula earlei]